jgi:hypothetical protein
VQENQGRIVGVVWRVWCCWVVKSSGVAKVLREIPAPGLEVLIERVVFGLPPRDVFEHSDVYWFPKKGVDT